jgi:carbamoyl-phosphate synthase small subunit
VESPKPQVEAFIVKEFSRYYSNWRSERGLEDYFKEHGVIGIEGVDTRALTRHIRIAGAMKAAISTEDLDEARVILRARESPGLVGRDLVKGVSCHAPFSWSAVEEKIRGGPPREGKCRFRVIAIDCGIKYNILRMLEKAGCDATVVPARTGAIEILSMSPDGLFLSNGPGDPKGVPYVIDTVKDLVPKVPIFGICLGHQLLGLALGGNTYKLKFGHRGANQPVKDLRSGKVDITSQNHGFCVDMKTLNEEEVELTHVNLNDQTLEGMRHRRHPVFSVQYHPEASPGPHDASYLFDSFVEMMEQRK